MSSDANASGPKPETDAHPGLGAGKVDQFESVFRAAAKAVFHYHPPLIERVLVATDLDAPAADAYARRVADLLGVLGEDVQWDTLPAGSFQSGADLLGRIEANDYDLICTYRHLRERSDWAQSLGTYVDVLTQSSRCPVLLTPHPRGDAARPHAMEDTDRVMAMTDHLTGEERLVSWAAAMTAPG